MTPKPALRSVPAGMRDSADPVARARERYGKPFAHEPGSTYKPGQVLFLTRWMAEQQAKRRPGR